MELSVTYKNGRFFAHNMENFSSVFNKNHLKKNGWKHNNVDGWFTTNLWSVSLLRDHADERVQNILNKSFIQHSPWKGTLTTPKGLKLLDHQPQSAYYSLSRTRSYLGLAPGLGKTIIAALIAVVMKNKVIIICPPFLTLNTLEEFKKWAPSILTKILDNIDWEVPDVLIVPDSQLHREDVRVYIRFFKVELLIIDEAHRFKTETAQRTKALLGHTFRNVYKPGIVDAPNLKKLVYMSGTPMPNRPIELFSILSKSAGQFIKFRNLNSYGMKYCAGFAVKNEYTGKVYGNDYTGCNEKEFATLMSEVKSKNYKDTNGFMLRLDKSILGLPPLTEEIVVLGEDMPRELKSMNAELLRMYSPKDLMRRMIALALGHETDSHLHLMTYRRLLGQYKVKPSVEYINSILEETDEDLLIVGYHKEVMKEVNEKLSDYSPLLITGDTPSMKRQSIVKEFQTNKNKRIILGNLDAIGVGFTLTKANRVLLIEWDWAPGKNRQVIDRGHRYGLNHPLLAQYLAFRNSLDRSHLETLMYKERITKHV